MKHYEKNALAYRLEMKEVRLNPQTTAWTLNGLGTELRDGRFLRYFPIRDAGRMAFGAILVLGAALCARGFFVKRNLWYPAIAILLLQWGIMLYITPDACRHSIRIRSTKQAISRRHTTSRTVFSTPGSGATQSAGKNKGGAGRNFDRNLSWRPHKKAPEGESGASE